MVVFLKRKQVHDNIAFKIYPRIQIHDEIKICENGCMKKSAWEPNFQEKTKIKIPL